MSEHSEKRKLKSHIVPGPVPIDGDHSIGEEALHFTRWFMKSKYHLMGGFVGELTHARDPAQAKARFRRTLNHAHRVHQVRGIVTLLLAMGVVAAAASSLANMMDVERTTAWLDRAVAFSTSASVVLVAARLLLDRYLERCDVAATFLAIELALARRG